MHDTITYDMYIEQFSSQTGLAILAAALTSVFIAFFWYHPRVFGRLWMQLAGMTPEMVEKGKQRALIYSFFGVVASICVAYVMFWFGAAWGISSVDEAIKLAFWCWIGFAAPMLLGSVIWEQRPIKLYFINMSYWLVSLIAMALILLF